MANSDRRWSINVKYIYICDIFIILKSIITDLCNTIRYYNRCFLACIFIQFIFTYLESHSHTRSPLYS